MNRAVLSVPALLLAAALTTGVPTAAAEDAVKPVAPPAELVGKWRHEVKDDKVTRVSVYHFAKDGNLVVEVRIDSPNLKANDSVKRAVVKVEEDRIAVTDISRIGPGGGETAIPAERRRTRHYQTEVKGDELRLTEVDEAGKAAPEAKPMVLKRVPE